MRGDARAVREGAAYGVFAPLFGPRAGTTRLHGAMQPQHTCLLRGRDREAAREREGEIMRDPFIWGIGR
eukprot:6037676-Prymnesium_polylepis.2